jgi:predicted  nucleic acid-binding Zn-ribbon protein
MFSMPVLTSFKHNKKKAAGVLAGLLAFGGFSTLTLPAVAADSEASGPRIKLTAIDTDVVAASGRDFAANANITIEAASKDLSGEGVVKVGADGRFLVAFKLPAGFDDQLKVTSKTPDVAAILNIEVPEENGSTTTTAAPGGTTTTVKGGTTTTVKDGTTTTTVKGGTTTTTAKATTTTKKVTTTTQKPATGTPDLDDKLLKLPEAAAYNTQVDAYNAAIVTYNSKVTSLNTALANATSEKKTAVTSDVNALNTKLAALNASTTAVNNSITELNKKAAAAKTQAELDALKPGLADLTSKLKANTAQVTDLNKDIDAISVKLSA